MARIKVILLDDEGQEINTRNYELSSELNNLSKIEKAVESLRPDLLGSLTQDLLLQEQEAFTKKTLISPTDTTLC